MNASHVEERTHFVLVKLTAEEARALAKDVVEAAEVHIAYGRKQEANRLEVFASCLGVALAQLPKEGE